MPQAIAAAIAAFQAGAGVSGAVGSFVATVTGSVNLGFAAAAATAVAAPFVLSAATAVAVAPDVPSPDSFATPKKQPITGRISAYGINRLSGPYMLWEAAGDLIFDVIALHDGRLASIDALWLNDDVITLGAGGVVNQGVDDRYQGGRLHMFTRQGAATETSYTTDTSFASLGGGVWTANHRGDGVASLCLVCKSVEQKDMAKTYPNGAPLASVTAHCLEIYDWRDGAQSQTDPSTWSCKFNPILQLADFLTHPDHGMGFDFATRILPSIADWTAAADVCDEAVTLKAGGTEPRYEAHGPFQHISSPADIIGKLLESCDGWLTQKGDGTFTVRAGKYAAPTVTFGDDHVVNYSVQRFLEDEQAINSLVVSFVSPDHLFQEVETDPWRDEDDITARGVERSQNLSLSWVHSNGQARRLAKRRMSRLGATVRGTVTTDLYGLRGLGERFIRLQISELNTLADIVIEVSSVEFDLGAMQLTYSWIAVDPNLDAWNPATEEGDGPATEDRVAPEALAQPTIDTATAYFESSGTGGDGVRLRLEVSGPDRSDLTWFARWRVVGAVSWNEAPYSDIDPAAAVVLETVFVTAGGNVEVEVAYKTGGGDQSPWSAATTVSTSTASVAPGVATSVTAAGGAGSATIGWRMPNSSNLASAKVWRNTTNNFGTATAASGDLAGGLGATMSFTNTGLSAGTYYFWVQTKSTGGAVASAVASTPTSVTVT